MHEVRQAEPGRLADDGVTARRVDLASVVHEAHCRLVGRGLASLAFAGCVGPGRV